MRLKQSAQLISQSEWPHFLGHPVQPTERGDPSVISMYVIYRRGSERDGPKSRSIT